MKISPVKNVSDKDFIVRWKINDYSIETMLNGFKKIKMKFNIIFIAII